MDRKTFLTICYILIDIFLDIPTIYVDDTVGNTQRGIHKLYKYVTSQTLSHLKNVSLSSSCFWLQEAEKQEHSASLKCLTQCDALFEAMLHFTSDLHEEELNENSISAYLFLSNRNCIRIPIQQKLTSLNFIVCSKFELNDSLDTEPP